MYCFLGIIAQSAQKGNERFINFRKSCPPPPPARGSAAGGRARGGAQNRKTAQDVPGPPALFLFLRLVLGQILPAPDQVALHAFQLGQLLRCKLRQSLPLGIGGVHIRYTEKIIGGYMIEFTYLHKKIMARLTFPLLPTGNGVKDHIQLGGKVFLRIAVVLSDLLQSFADHLYHLTGKV